MEAEKINVSGDSFPVLSPWSEPVKESVFSIAPQTVPDYLSIDAVMDKLRVDWDEQPRSVCTWEEELERDLGRKIKASIKPLDTRSLWAEEAEKFKISAQPLSTWVREEAEKFKISAQPLSDISIWAKEEGELCRTSVLSKLNSMWGEVPSFQPMETTVYAEDVVMPRVTPETPRVLEETPKPLPVGASASGLLRVIDACLDKWSHYTFAHLKKVMEDKGWGFYSSNADFGRQMAQVCPKLKPRTVGKSVSRNSHHIACHHFWEWKESPDREICEKIEAQLNN